MTFDQNEDFSLLMAIQLRLSNERKLKKSIFWNLPYKWTIEKIGKYIYDFWCIGSGWYVMGGKSKWNTNYKQQIICY